VLSTIGKVLWDFIEEYWGIRKSLQDLVEGQERNTVQLARIGTIINQRWSLKEDPWDSDKKSEGEGRKDENGDEKGTEERSEEN